MWILIPLLLMNNEAVRYYEPWVSSYGSLRACRAAGEDLRWTPSCGPLGPGLNETCARERAGPYFLQIGRVFYDWGCLQHG